MPSKRGPKFNPHKRRLKGRRPTFSPEVKARILGSVVKGEQHWTLDPDDWGLPTADKGSRRIVFETTYGPVSPTSIVYSICNEPECVRPEHCRAENIDIHKQRMSGKLPRLIFTSGKHVQTVEEFERSLRATASQLQKATVQREHAELERRVSAERKAAILRSISSVEDPQARPGFGRCP